jgi:hypothetical protein
MKYICQNCGWKGTHESLAFGHDDYYCPSCLQEGDMVCNEPDCRRDHDYCCDCVDGSLYRSPDAYELVGGER